MIADKVGVVGGDNSAGKEWLKNCMARTIRMTQKTY